MTNPHPPIAMLVSEITSDFEKRHAWLLKAGEQAKRLNEESKRD